MRNAGKQEPVYDTVDGHVTVYDDVSKNDAVPPTTIELKECPAYAPNSQSNTGPDTQQ